MPKLRIGFSTDFNLKNEQVGVGTDNPTARLDVRGNILAVNISDTGGISTISRYDGFLNPNLTLSERTTELSIPNKGNLNTLSGEIVISGEVTVEGDTPLAGGRLDSLTVTGKFDLPHGGTEDREETPEKGSTRFNEDLGQLEFYTGLEWRTVGSYDGSGRGRGVFVGGNNSSNNDVSSIEYIQISTLGNAINFGDSTIAGSRKANGSASTGTRGFAVGSNDPSNWTTIEYFTIPSAGNAIDFGNLNTGRGAASSHSSSTRAVIAGGRNPASITTIDYFEMNTTGSALEFGNLATVTQWPAGAGSPTRMLIGGGEQPGRTADVSYLTISSKGNATEVGDLLTQIGSGKGSCSNNTRAIFSGGDGPGSLYLHSLDSVEISSLGNATRFGDLSEQRAYSVAVSNSTRGVFGGGYTPSTTNVMDYITIASVGNAIDFGDLSTPRKFGHSACSDSHGGLGGF